MKRTDVQWIVKSCGGRLFGNPEGRIRDVVIDSRSAGPERMFVAVIGPNRDGHDFIKDAMDRGSRVFLISREDRVPAVVAQDPSVSVILTDDTEPGLARIARAYLDQFTLHRVAVTGSVGKTTTKEMTGRVLSGRYRTVATSGNLNTLLGICLTAFQVESDTEAVVFEMGMDRKGEIESYCRWIRPHIAIITNVGTAHLERLGSREAIAAAKLEITSCLTPDDVLVFNSDSEYLSLPAIEKKMKNVCRLCPVGTGEDAQYRLSGLRPQGSGAAFMLAERGSGPAQSFSLPIPGLHNALNAALAAAAGRCLGVSLRESSAALAGMVATERRLHMEILPDVTLIDDTYNAGPDSMKAALDVLAATEGKRRIAVLADILELGSFLEEGHRSVGRHVAETDPDVLIAVGVHAEYYALGAEEAGFGGELIRCGNKEEAMAFLSREIRSGDVILVKGSNATGVADIARQIRRRGKPEEGN